MNVSSVLRFCLQQPSFKMMVLFQQTSAESGHLWHCVSFARRVYEFKGQGRHSIMESFVLMSLWISPEMQSLKPTIIPVGMTNSEERIISTVSISPRILRYSPFLIVFPSKKAISSSQVILLANSTQSLLLRDACESEVMNSIQFSIKNIGRVAVGDPNTVNVSERYPPFSTENFDI